MKKRLNVIILLIITNQIIAQDYKFGKVSKEELEEKFYPQDSSANAAYLYKKRRTYTTVLGGKISLITEVHVRMKIYTKKGFDWATESISLYGSIKSSSETISNLKATTYNLIDGEIEEIKLNKKNVFSVEKSRSWKEKKFTMPNVKEGSVLEWTYKIYSPYFYKIDDVLVQYKIPVKKYETKLVLLEWLIFNKRVKGYYPFRIQETYKNNPNFKTKDKVIEIIEENIPALKSEPYVNNIYNYAAGLKLEVASLRAPELGLYENYTTNWEEIAKNINKNSAFGGELNKVRHLKEDIITLKNELKTFDSKIMGSLQYVKSKIKWNENFGKYTEKGLRKAYDEGSGNCADINLTLVAVLRELGIEANPVLVSTRSNGLPIFPTNRGFNYVVVVVETADGTILLDASEKYSLPNVLPLRAVNWNGTIVRENGTVSFVDLGTTIVSSKVTNLNYKISEDGFIEGINRVVYENYSAISHRNKNSALNEESIISAIEEENNDIELLNFRMLNLNDISKPISELYKFEKDQRAEKMNDKIYFKPLLFMTKTESPFKLETREYPIDFGSPWSEKVSVSIQIPAGFEIESIPESLAIGIRNNIGTYRYSIANNGNLIQIIAELKINEGVITANYYPEIKEFYKILVNKNLEQIVLKKI